MCSVPAGRWTRSWWHASRAVGCVALDPLVAPEPVPPFANSAVDGFGVRAARHPRRLGVVAGAPGRHRDHPGRGRRPTSSPGPGQAVRIMTGAPVPGGVDAVVMVEDSRPAGRRRYRSSW